MFARRAPGVLQNVDCESLSPTRGATQQSVDCESLTPTQGATQSASSSKLIEERTALALAESSGIGWGVAKEKSILCETLWRVRVSASTLRRVCGGGGMQKKTASFGEGGWKDHRHADVCECGTCHLNMCPSCMPLQSCSLDL